MEILHLNDLFSFLGVSAHTVLTELDDQKLFGRGRALIKGTDSYISYTFLFL